MIKYYEVAVENRAIAQQDVLTYSSQLDIPLGSIVQVPLGKRLSNGIIFKNISKKPKFKTRDIEQVLFTEVIPLALINTLQWMAEYYMTQLPHVVQHVLPRGAQKKRRDVDMSWPKAKRLDQNHKLNSDQKAAIKTMNSKPATYLLRGVTGSGKTKVYMELAREAVKNKKGVVVLVPEIGLTTQLVSDFATEFKQVFVMHSALSESARQQIWEEVAKADVPVVVGARSALFAPIHKLGLIVIDEEHEAAYKQDKNPKYHAVRVAAKLRAEHNATLVLGSATPSIEDSHLAETHAAVIRMDKAIKGFETSVITEVVDLKKKDGFTRSKSMLLSDVMLEAMEESIKLGKQVLLFHNRRGTNTNVLCTSCGWLSECPDCLLPLTHHHDLNQLQCHICGHKDSVPFACPDCKEPALLFKGVGTKQIVEEVKKFFPKINIARFDSDLKANETLAKRYQELFDGSIQIIVGTQMVAKGLDLPNLHMVGVIRADTTLYMPDFSANERAFQLLYQVIGRVGRHDANSRVVIQSYTPDHSAITTAVLRDYDAFYANELSQRKASNYPPFTYLLSLKATRKSQKEAMQTTKNMASKLSKLKDVEVLGPSPAFHEISRSGSTWQVVVKSANRRRLQNIVAQLPSKWTFDLDPDNLL